jgi:L-ascorbate metabolism protein UlaG (beta-lactamase superfamily)
MAAGRLTYVGHATALIEEADVRILTDPLLRRRVAHLWRRVPVPRLEDLADVDAVLISHAHADHLDLPSLRKLRHNGPVVAPRGCARILVQAGVGQVIELTAGDRWALGTVAVEAVPARHDGRRHPFARRMPALGFLLDGPSRIYFAGDTDLFDGMEMLAGRVDVALLPISGWGPRLPRGHLDPPAAARAAAIIRPAIAIPIHWGTMQSVGARSDEHRARAFAAAVAALAPSIEVHVLAPGESISLYG